MKFTEAKLEQTFIELLGIEGYPHSFGNTIVRSVDEVLIEADFREYLNARYHSENITVAEINTILLQLKNLPASDLYESNKTIMQWLADGFILKREDRSQKDIHIELIDYSGLTEHKVSNDIDIIAAEPKEAIYNKTYNNYKVITQLEITGTEKRIPDMILYINGLPLVVFEFKTAIQENCTIHNAYVQLTTRYKRDIPELFKYSAFCVISDGVNTKAGSFFAPYDFYYAWRSEPDRKLFDVDGFNSMFSMIHGMFNKKILRDIIQNFIYIPDSSKKDEKIVCRYPQYYAARSLYESIKKAEKPEGDG